MTKHSSVKYHLVREAVSNMKVDLVYCNSKEQVIKISTEELPSKIFEYSICKVGVLKKSFKKC